MTFADLNLSRRLERAEAQAGIEFAQARARLQPGTSAAWIEHAGTIAVFDGPESPITQTFCLGLFEEPTSAALDVIERFFLDRGAPVTHEVSPHAGIATVQLLSERGYRPIELSSVMHQPVRSTAPEFPEMITVRVTNSEDASLWAELSAKGWASENPEMEDVIRQFGRLGFARANTVNFIAEASGVAGATGSICVHHGVALFGGASTIPDLRCRGLQAALLSYRMDYAARIGLELAMMVTTTGSQSQRNAERTGFRIAYSRTKWQLTKGA